MSANDVAAVVATCTNAEQPAPWQRSTSYEATPKSSVAAVHDRFTWLDPDAAAAKLDGAEGGLSTATGVTAVATAEYAPRLPAASRARTR